MSPRGIWSRNQTVSITGESYTFFDRLGHGRFASVWASTTANGDPVAVKVFDLKRTRNNINSSQRMDSFQTELLMANKLRNEIKNVVTTYAYDFDPRKRLGFIVMELGDETLEDRIKNLHQMHTRSKIDGYDYISTRDRKNIWIHLVNIILALYQHRVVHRDIKPANLVFFGSTLKVVDFGIAQDEFVRYDGHRRLGGTHPYSAPECFSGRARITSKADIWSAGAILYYLTYGKSPVYETPRPPRGILQTRSTLVQDVLHRCFHRNPRRRADHQWLAQHPLTNKFSKRLTNIDFLFGRNF